MEWPAIPEGSWCWRSTSHERATDKDSTTRGRDRIAEGVIPSLMERFNSGEISAMMGLYDPEAVLIADDGRTVTDRAEISAELERDLSLGLPLQHLRANLQAATLTLPSGTLAKLEALGTKSEQRPKEDI